MLYHKKGAKTSLFFPQLSLVEVSITATEKQTRQHTHGMGAQKVYDLRMSKVIIMIIKELTIINGKL